MTNNKNVKINQEKIKQFYIQGSKQGTLNQFFSFFLNPSLVYWDYHCQYCQSPEYSLEAILAAVSMITKEW